MENQNKNINQSTGNFFGDPISNNQSYSPQINNPLTNQNQYYQMNEKENQNQNQNYFNQNQNYFNQNQNQNYYNQNQNYFNQNQNQNYYNQNQNQNYYNTNQYVNYNNQNISQQNTQMYPQQSQTFMQKLNSTASEVFDYLKSKTPSIPNITLPKNPLAKIDLTPTLTEINSKNFENEMENNITEVNCIKIEKSKLNDVNLICVIENPKIINDSYFKPSYVLYDIITKEFNWAVTRRYSDFIWLKEILQAIFPTEILPMLPHKQITNRFDKNFIDKRMKGLQKFLNEILKNENLKSCESLTVFLSCSDRNFFEQEMRVLNTKILSPPTINHIRTMDGKIKLMNFENIQNSFNYFSNINNFFKCQNNIINDILNNLNQFNYNIALACNNLEEVEKGFNKVNSLTEKVKLSDTINNVYIQYDTFFKNWKRILMNESLIFQDKVISFFENIVGKTDNFSDLLVKQESLKDDFISRNGKLNIKKEAIWQKMDIKNFELNPFENIDPNQLYRDKKYAFEKMFYKETEEMNRIRGFIQYYYYQNYINFQNLINEFEKSYNNNLKEFTSSIEPSITNGVEVWSFLSSNIPQE
jgi:sorting nexin-7/30/sorting nexin-8